MYRNSTVSYYSTQTSHRALRVKEDVARGTVLRDPGSWGTETWIDSCSEGSGSVMESGVSEGRTQAEDPLARCVGEE